MNYRTLELERTTSAIIVALAVWTVLYPRAFSDGRFAPITDVISDGWMTCLLMMVGVGRSIALFYNGKWRVYGAIIRMIGALGGGAIFFQMALALWISNYRIGAEPSPGIAVYLLLTCAEAYSAYRAAADAHLRAR